MSRLMADARLALKGLLKRPGTSLVLILTLAAGLAANALVLAVGGVYGVMSYRVSQRTPEIGVRVALGASRRDILRPVLGHAVWLSAIGLTLGAALAWGAGRLVSSTLLGAVSFDARVLATMTAMLLLAAVVAAWVPSRRAMRLDPVRVLRAE